MMFRFTLAALAGAGMVGFLWWQDVPTQVSSKDEMAIATILAERDVTPMPAAYEDQVLTIAAVQAAVLDASPRYKSIPKGQTREPADLLLAGKGFCHDRARTIEKALDTLGFEVRHVSVYPSTTALLLPTSAPSHALSEVKTSRGWMLVDSVSTWLGIDADRNPVSAERLSKGDVELAMQIPEIIKIMAGDFVPVIGLYSRHGQFYPPYTPFPDVNWRQLITGNL